MKNKANRIEFTVVRNLYGEEEEPGIYEFFFRF